MPSTMAGDAGEQKAGETGKKWGGVGCVVLGVWCSGCPRGEVMAKTAIFRLSLVTCAF